MYGDIMKAKFNHNGNLHGYCDHIDSSGHHMTIEFEDGKIVDGVEDFKKMLNPSLLKCIELGLCTRAFTKKIYYPQIYYSCITCNIMEEQGIGICETCVKLCHKDHKIVTKPVLSKGYYCDCHIKGLCLCFEYNRDYSILFNNMASGEVIYHDLLPNEDKK
jgi:hypothetical protein